MGHSPDQIIEHAEHAAHAAHETFDKMVTISIAIIAAGLATVSILGHKAHNMMLSKQLQGAIYKNQESDKWAEYQAYNIRSHFYQTMEELAKFSVPVPGAEEQRTKALERWKAQFAKYEKANLPQAKKEAKEFAAESEKLLDEAIFLHHKAERLDLGDLGLQFGIVLASLAILTKKRRFWFIGVTAAVLGFAVAMTGHFGIWLGHHEGHAAQEGEKGHGH